MNSVRIATWNINSVRLRRAQVGRFLKIQAPDVLCLQETKCPDELFPAAYFRARGYAHQAISGQKGYHGVAIVSRLPFRQTDALVLCGKDDKRHISVTLENGLELHNFYVPAGGDTPDPERNPKFAHKLAFLDEMEARFARERARRHEPIVLVGDLNVAPFENDVWSHRQLLGVVSHTPAETSRMMAAVAAFEWIDVTRAVVPMAEKIFSWWSYRNRDWKKSDRGRRLDHIWVSQGLRGAVTEHAILRPMRDWRRTSDHVPVLATVTL